MTIVDSHCHLDFEDYAQDLPEVLARARAAGVVTMVCIGSGRDIGSARSAVALAAREADIFAAVGVHPHDVAHMTHSPRDAQGAAFRRFVALARAARRPIVCHIRDAHVPAAEVLRDEGAAEVGGVIHCFTGGVEDARRYLDLGFYLSFSGILTFKNAGSIREAAAFAPGDRLMVETDAPYLAPIPHRGKRNEPAFVVETLALMAQLRGTSFEDAAALTTANTRRLFAIP
jgi:TatD DNase family protein